MPPEMGGQQHLPGAIAQEFHEAQSRKGKDTEPKPVCRFWGSKSDCRAGSSCRFYHDPALASASTVQTTTPRSPGSGKANDAVKPERRRYQAAVDSSKVVQKPRPQVQVQVSDPREFQLQQLKRRFSPVEIPDASCTNLEIKMPPSDPDFPFDMAYLDSVLTIPQGYPTQKPRLQVRNKDMGRGYQINIEKGFDGIVKEFPNSTLLGWMNILDRRLEELLTGEKAETIKLVSNRGRTDATKPSSAPSRGDSGTAQPSQALNKTLAAPSQPSYSNDELAVASQRRATETRQLEARLGRQPLFFKSRDGLAYTLPVEPARRNDLPVALQSTKTLRLIVPALYPLAPCAIELQGVSREAATKTEQAFRERAMQTKQASLVAHLNYLAQNMHLFATRPEPKPEPQAAETTNKASALTKALAPNTAQHSASAGADDNRSHIQVIPRPPEWEAGYNESDTGSDSDSSGYYSTGSASDSGDAEGDDADDDADGEQDAEAYAAATSSGPERGVALDFPNIVLSNISLAAVTSLSLTVSCARCKTRTDIAVSPSSQPSTNTAVPTTAKTETNTNTATDLNTTTTCPKCSSLLRASFRALLLHANNTRAGYLDLNGCAVSDLQSCTFSPTCSSCSTLYKPSLTGVRGDSSHGICRDCHTHLRLSLPEAKFLIVSASATAGLPPRKMAPRESLGLVAGAPLPKTGLCGHYRHSHRWFRFGCCNRVFACDRCHDAEAGHPFEYGNRMVCGWCSREQSFKKERCGVCRGLLVKGRGRGFWEGGRGTRDKKLMSRKDARKFKRTGEDKRVEKERKKKKEKEGES